MGADGFIGSPISPTGSLLRFRPQALTKSLTRSTGLTVRDDKEGMIQLANGTGNRGSLEDHRKLCSGE